VPRLTLREDRRDPAHAHAQQPVLERAEERRPHPDAPPAWVDRDAQHPGAFTGDPCPAGTDHLAVGNRHDGGGAGAERLDHLRDAEQRRAGAT